MTSKQSRRILVAAALMPLTAAAGVAVIHDPAPLTEAAPQTPQPVSLPQSQDVEVSAPITVPSKVKAPKKARKVNVKTNGAAGDIPSTALSAYQRAAQVVATADASCKISWQLIAAIGRVESNHGRFGGAVLGADGVSTPLIVGMRLDGTGATSRINDTDGGKLDGDKSFDRAVGPMQFLPSTWRSIAVDADQDGVRNPQDIDDAALGTAVYLCVGDGDLSDGADVRAAVHSYNHSTAYVEQVMSVYSEYVDASFQTAQISAFGSVDSPSALSADSAPLTGSASNPAEAGQSRSNGGAKSGKGENSSGGDSGTSWSSIEIKPKPPAKKPPVVEPPVEEPPVKEPPVKEPPVKEPPVKEPPVKEPPVEEPPVNEPPLPEPPVVDPPVVDPPVEISIPEVCANLGFSQIPGLDTDLFDGCVANHDAFVAAVDNCVAAGLANDPARNDDPLDLCVAAALPNLVVLPVPPVETPEPTPTPPTTPAPSPAPDPVPSTPAPSTPAPSEPAPSEPAAQ